MRKLAALKSYYNLISFIIRHKPTNLKYIIRLKTSKLKRYQTYDNEIPWITYDSKKWLDSYLKLNMTVIEYGSGGSTFYFSKKAKKVISLEHNKKYYEIIAKKVKQNNYINCDLQLCESIKNYIRYIDKFPDNYFDFVFVDGLERSSCIKHAISKIKTGGFLMLDNSELIQHQKGRILLNGYDREDFYGFGPYRTKIWQTSIWRIK